jgi:hypothetical protein
VLFGALLGGGIGAAAGLAYIRRTPLVEVEDATESG